jgi:hypothetical protein
MKGLKIIGGITIVLLVILIGITWYKNAPNPMGSISLGSSYKSTTTSSAVVNPVIKTEGGTLGSVILAITGTAPLTIYDATTTDATKRTITATSSLRVLAYFGASPTVGTYTFDSEFYYGLLASWGSGTIASTTITYR